MKIKELIDQLSETLVDASYTLEELTEHTLKLSQLLRAEIELPVPAPTPTPTPTPTGYSVGTNGWFLAPAWGEDPLLPDLSVNPAWVADMRGISTLRTMDWSCVNFSEISSWSQRRSPADPSNRTCTITDAGSLRTVPGMAPELQCAIANAVGCDLWLNVPHKADNDYVQQLAAVVQQHLDPKLGVWFEYSNETWNGGFSQFNYVIEKGSEAGLAGMNQWYQGQAFSVKRSLELYALFSAACPRAKHVVCWSGDPALMNAALKTQYTQQVPIHMLACAPYVAVAADVSVSGWKLAVDKLVEGEPIRHTLQMASAHGIDTTGIYEWGSDVGKNAHVFCERPEVTEMYDYALDRFASSGLNGPCCHYAAHGAWNSTTGWGAQRRVGDSTPRYASLVRRYAR